MNTPAPLDFVHRFVPGTSSRTLLLLHGTGGNELDLLSLGHELDRGASLLSPRGKVLEQGMPRFFRRLGEGVFDEKDLIKRTHELADFIAAASKEYAFDHSQTIAVGFSNGANIAGALLLLRPEAIFGAALLRPMVPLTPAVLPDLKGRPVLVVSADQDQIVPAENARRLVALLRQAGADVTFSVENAGHVLTPASVETTRRWLAQIAA